MPVRKIGMSSRSVTWDFVSVKTNSTHRCESTLEFDFAYLAEFDPLVNTFEAQPVSIPYVNAKGRKVKYTPDFKITYTKNGALQKGAKFSLIEIKYTKELEICKDEFAPKFKAAKNYCQAKGGDFEIFNEQTIRTTKLASCKFLYRYIDESETPKLNFNFINLANSLKEFTPKDWVNNIEGSELIKGQALSNLWHLIAKGFLEIDLDKTINMKTKIRLK